MCAGRKHPEHSQGDPAVPFFFSPKGASLVLKKIHLSTLFVFFFLLLSPAEGSPRRIVSLTPVGTEMLYALGPGENIIAVTEFCDYPAEARRKEQIGGFAGFNLEALLARKTDLLVLSDIHEQFLPQVRAIGIPSVLLRQKRVEDIFTGLSVLGAACGAEERASGIIASIRDQMEDVRRKASSLPSRPRVLLSVSRDLAEKRLTSVYIAGRNTFYDELIEMAGGQNASREEGILYPRISLEGVLKIAPEIIFDLVGDKAFYHSVGPVDLETLFDPAYLKAGWKKSADVPATREDRIFIFDGTVFLRPGPRVASILRAFAEKIHPEIPWGP